MIDQQHQHDAWPIADSQQITIVPSKLVSSSSLVSLLRPLSFSLFPVPLPSSLWFSVAASHASELFVSTKALGQEPHLPAVCMGERGHNGTDGTPTGAVSGVEGWARSAPLHRSRGLGVPARDASLLGNRKTRFP